MTNGKRATRWWVIAAVLGIGAAGVALAGVGRISVPIRWCAIEGSSAAEDPDCACEDFTNQVLWRRHERASQAIYLPSCNMAWRSAAMEQQPTFPVIQDPCDGGVDAQCAGETGDVVLAPNAGLTQELDDALLACYIAWDAMGVGTVGVMGLNVRRFVNPDGQPNSLMGLAGVPGFSTESQMTIGFFSVVDNDFTFTPTLCAPPGTCEMENVDLLGDPSDRAMGHEGAHSISLSHMNPPPSTLMAETLSAATDVLTTGGPGQIATSCPNGQPVFTSQCGRIRTQALCHVPGATVEQFGLAKPEGVEPQPLVVDDAPLVSGNVSTGIVDLVLLGLVDDPASSQASFVWRMGEAFPVSASGLDYSFALDLDDDPATGGTTTTIGLALPLAGVELAGRILVDVSFDSPSGEKIFTISRQLWQFNGGGMTPVDSIDAGAADIDVIADSFPPGPSQMFQIGAWTSLRFDRAFLAGAVTPRFRARAVDPLTGAADLSAEGRFYMIPPVLPRCSAVPASLLPGDDVSVTAGNLTPGRLTSVFLGAAEIAQGSTNVGGFTQSTFDVPAGTAPGAYLVTIRSQNANDAITADCSLTVLDSTAPGIAPKLRASRVADDLVLSWNPPGGACAADDYAVYSGDLLALPAYDHAQRTCSTLGATSFATPVAGVSATEYFLVVPLTPSAEGSYGLASDGVERPPAPAACRAAQNTNECR